MAADELPARELITLALEAISSRSAERLRPLLAEDVRVETGRATHRGIEAVLCWAEKSYQHLDRRYVISGFERSGSSYLVPGRAEYVWRDSGEVGDSTPAFLVFTIEEGRIALVSLQDDERAARDLLESL